MSYQSLQLFPQASTEVASRRIAIQDSRCASVSSLQQTDFLPSGLEDELGLNEVGDPRVAISWLAISAAFSASVWAGIALILMHWLK